MSARWRTPVPPLGVDPEEWADLLVVAATILGEAEGESLTGKRAVGYVIMNRSRDHRWPDTPSAVCLERLQFSCWNVGSPRVAVMLQPQGHTSEGVWNDCFRAAMEAMFGIEPDPTGGATHYLNPEVTRAARGGSMPSWYDPAKVTATIGAHEFLRL